jgi:hypothetical protein
MKNPKKEIVLKYYPQAKPVKVKNHVEIWSNDTYLGKGKTNYQAWSAAYNQNVNI